MTENSQSVSKVDGSTIVQVAGDMTVVNTPISGEVIKSLEEICRDVTRREMEQYTAIAYTKAQGYVDCYVKAFSKRLGQLEETTKEKLQEPAVQISLRKSIIGSMNMDDEDIKEENIDLMIERIKVDSKSTDKFIIEKAIEILPQLSMKHLSYLALCVFFDLKLGYTCAGLENILSNSMDKLLDAAGEISRLDIHYLTSLGLHNNVMMFLPRKNYLENLSRSYNLFFSEFGSKDDFFEIYKKFGINEAHAENHWHATGDKSNPNRLPFLDVLKILISNDELFAKINGLLTPVSNQEVHKQLVSYNSKWDGALNALNSKDSLAFYLDPVARYIGMRMLNRFVNTTLDYTIFYK